MRLKRNLWFGRFYDMLVRERGREKAREIWKEIEGQYARLLADPPEIHPEAKNIALPLAAIYRGLLICYPKEAGDEAMHFMLRYGEALGERLKKALSRATAVPGVSGLLWRNMPKIMRRMSSAKLGYEREIVSETRALCALNVLRCPYADVCRAMGIPEAARAICAADKVYMNGMRNIRYTRTQSVAEGDPVCDYRLAWDEKKK